MVFLSAPTIAAMTMSFDLHEKSEPRAGQVNGAGEVKSPAHQVEKADNEVKEDGAKPEDNAASQEGAKSEAKDGTNTRKATQVVVDLSSDELKKASNANDGEEEAITPSSPSSSFSKENEVNVKIEKEQYNKVTETPISPTSRKRSHGEIADDSGNQDEKDANPQRTGHSSRWQEMYNRLKEYRVRCFSIGYGSSISTSPHHFVNLKEQFGDCCGAYECRVCCQCPTDSVQCSCCKMSIRPISAKSIFRRSASWTLGFFTATPVQGSADWPTRCKCNEWRENFKTRGHWI